MRSGQSGPNRSSTASATSDGQLRDVQVFVDEDQRAVIVFADWSTDTPVYATVPLNETYFRYQYDLSALAEWFQSSELGH
jgi:hypothetical protein